MRQQLGRRMPQQPFGRLDRHERQRQPRLPSPAVRPAVRRPLLVARPKSPALRPPPLVGRRHHRRLELRERHPPRGLEPRKQHHQLARQRPRPLPAPRHARHDEPIPGPRRRHVPHPFPLRVHLRLQPVAQRLPVLRLVLRFVVRRPEPDRIAAHEQLVVDPGRAAGRVAPEDDGPLEPLGHVDGRDQHHVLGGREESCLCDAVLPLPALADGAEQVTHAGAVRLAREGEETAHVGHGLAAVLALEREVREEPGLADQRIEQFGDGHAVAQLEEPPRHRDRAHQPVGLFLRWQLDRVQVSPVRRLDLLRDGQQRVVAQSRERAAQEAEQSAVVERIADRLQRQHQVEHLALLVEALVAQHVDRHTLRAQRRREDRLRPPRREQQRHVAPLAFLHVVQLACATRDRPRFRVPDRVRVPCPAIVLRRNHDELDAVRDTRAVPRRLHRTELDLVRCPDRVRRPEDRTHRRVHEIEDRRHAPEVLLQHVEPARALVLELELHFVPDRHVRAAEPVMLCFGSPTSIKRTPPFPLPPPPPSPPPPPPPPPAILHAICFCTGSTS